MTLVAFLPYYFFFDGDFSRSKQDILDRVLRTEAGEADQKEGQEKA